MYKIVSKKKLNNMVIEIKISISLKESIFPGQYILVRVTENSEKIQVPIFDYNEIEKILTIFLYENDSFLKEIELLSDNGNIYTIEGPLGKIECYDDVKKVALVGTGLGVSILYTHAKKLYSKDVSIFSFLGYKSKEYIFLEEEFKKLSKDFYITTDDGSRGKKGLPAYVLEDMIKKGEKFDLIIADGSLILMKVIKFLASKYSIKTIMIMTYK